MKSKHISSNERVLVYLFVFIIACYASLLAGCKTAKSTEVITQELGPIPDDLVTIDTIVHYNHVADYEKIEIKKRVSDEMDDYLRNIKFSGEVITLYDTIHTFDTNTFSEVVNVVQTTCPKEYAPVMKKTELYNGHYISLERAMELMEIQQKKTKRKKKNKGLRPLPQQLVVNNGSTVQISKDMDKYLRKIKYSGEMETFLDTIAVRYDYDLNKEVVDVVETTYPIEFKDLLANRRLAGHGSLFLDRAIEYMHQQNKGK